MHFVRDEPPPSLQARLVALLFNSKMLDELIFNEPVIDGAVCFEFNAFRATFHQDASDTRAREMFPS